MRLKYDDKTYITDNDLNVTTLGRFPEIVIKNEKLKKYFLKEFERDFLGGDEIISFRQSLVARGMNFIGLEEELLEYIENPDKSDLKDAIFNKTATGIGRGHSMGGLAGVTLGLQGTKMIDSALTGLVASRSLVTSGRRRSVGEEDIVIPTTIAKRDVLLKEYLEISRAAFKESKSFKEKFGRLDGIESFNKALSYNNPADLFIVLPLDTMATLAFEVKQDEINPNGPFLPREIHTLVKRFSDITKENGLGIMYKQRIEVPRGTYFHYNVFKDPNLPNYPSELAEKLNILTKPQLIDSNINLTNGFKKSLKNLKDVLEQTRKITDPKEIAKASIKCMLATRDLTGEYNEAVRVTILDSLSFRVWSEQKRHATLRQNVESIYSAAKRASNGIKEFWQQIEEAYKNSEDKNLPLDKIEKIIVVDKKLKKHSKLLVPYIYHTARQLIFYDKLVNEDISLRDAAFMIPRNIRLRNIENYDLVNMIDLELPLRLCSECEPERYMTSWKKRNLIAKTIPELKYFLQPKCSTGFCTEKEYCNHITNMRDYNKELHTKTKKEMLNKAI
ncbi:hypothetical protein CMI40_01815 [Candidatus Pacearchaeota archaeon]|jgi:hypothetical protein|nr:hypothetical protein [Candidatus Pacearchaeota archaeon]|tara:strand:- start:16958 stop:18637 length:1680 start_codon:yes stop_codon:yes gene_type:complete